jgi:hypothetical protein
VREKFRVGAGWGFCLILLLSSCGSGKILKSSESPRKNPTEGKQVRYIDIQNPSIAHAVEPGDSAEVAKFVQIEIVEVQNAKRYVATFRVEYQPREGEKIFLGAFSLYPPDNPATFIVSTHGKVKSEGSIIVSLIIPRDYRQGDLLKVGVGKIKFVDRKEK